MIDHSGASEQFCKRNCAAIGNILRISLQLFDDSLGYGAARDACLTHRGRAVHSNRQLIRKMSQKFVALPELCAELCQAG